VSSSFPLNGYRIFSVAVATPLPAGEATARSGKFITRNGAIQGSAGQFLADKKSGAECMSKASSEPFENKCFSAAPVALTIQAVHQIPVVPAKAGTTDAEDSLRQEGLPLMDMII